MLIQKNKKKFWVSLSFILIYFSIFNSFTANFISKKFLPNNIQFQFQSVSLFFGIELKNLEISSLDKNLFKEKIISSSRINLKYNLWKLLLGKISIEKISLVEPKILIEKKNNNLNLNTIFLKSDSKNEETEKKIDSLKTYIPISLNAFFIIQNLEIGYIDFEKKVNLKNLNLDVKLKSSRFRELCFQLKDLENIEELSINLNPKNQIQLSYDSKDINLNQNLDSKIILNYLKNDLSSLEIFLGNENFYFEKKNKKIPISFLARSNINSNDKKNLEMKFFEIVFDKNKILDLFGKLNIEKFEYSISFNPTNFNLNSLNQVLSNFLNDEISGNLEIKKSKLEGNLEDLKLDLNLILKNFLYKTNKKIHRIPNLVLNSNLELKPKHKENLIPYLEKAVIDSSFIYNYMSFKLKSDFELEKKILVNLDLGSVEISSFLNSMNGKLSGKLDLEGKSIQEINLFANFNLKDFDFFIENSKSQKSQMALNTNLKFFLNEKLKPKQIQIQKLGLNLKNKIYEDAALIEAQSEINFSEDLNLNFKKISIQSNLNKILSILPIYLKEKIFKLKPILGEEQKILGSIQVLKKKTSFSVNSKLDLGISGLNIQNGKLNLDSEFFNESKFLDLKNLELKLFSDTLKLKTTGNINLNPKPNEKNIFGIKPDLKGSLSLISIEPKEILKGYLYNGIFKLDFLTSGSVLDTKLISNSSNLFYSRGVCAEENLKNCKMFYLNGIDFDFDLKHDFDTNLKFAEISNSKSKFISESSLIKKPNFQMQNMFLSIPNIQAELVEVIQGTEKEKGLRFNLEYVDNQVKISNLFLKSFDGKILGENCNFLLGNLNPEKMEFEGRILFRDIDLKQLISEKSKKSIDDGKLSGDINLSGKNLNDPIQNLDLYLNIFKIGEDFGKSAIRVVRPPNLFLDVIISSYSQIDKIDFNLSKGLVYSEIKFNRAILPTLLTSIKDNSLKQDRIPLANFLNQAKKEIVRYE